MSEHPSEPETLLEQMSSNMWTTAFDAGGHEADKDFVSVAGFIAREKDWIAFDSQWIERIKREGIECYHHTEHGRNTALVSDLVDIIYRHVHHKFICIVPKTALVVLPEDVRKHFLLAAFSLGGRTVAQHVKEWLLFERKTPDARVKYVFEDGDLKKGWLEKRMRVDGYPPPIFRPKKDEKRKSSVVKGFTPLQAADILACETFRAARDGGIPSDLLRELERTVFGPMTCYTETDVGRIKEVLGTDYDWVRRYTRFL